MSTDPWDVGNTDLIDVGEIPTEFDEDQTQDRGALPPGTPARVPPRGGDQVTIAELKDRFAAFLVDVIVLAIFYWPAMLMYRAVAFGTAAGPIPLRGFHGLLFHGIFLLIAFLWLTLSEFALSASPGKMLCHLAVRKINGAPLSIGAAAIRNLLLPIDLLLLPALIPAALMECTAWRRRIGDLAAGTLVVRKLGRAPRQHALTADMIASATRRALAFGIDLALIGAFSGGYALLLSPEQPMFSMLLVVSFPLLLFAFVLVPEWRAQTSPGKWILGLAVCHEDGTAITLSTAVVRNLWRVFDGNPIGFLTALLSPHRQRPGDAAAGSLVIRAARTWGGLAALIVTGVLSAALLSAGLQNRNNLLSGDFEVNFLPSVDLTGGGGNVETMREKNFGVRNVRFAADDQANLRKPSIFHPGETLFLLFDVVGFTMKDKGVWIQEDLSISYPDGALGLKLENINEFKQELTERGPIAFENHIALPETAQPGRYTVTVSLRDKLGRRELKEQRFFYITSAEEPRAEAEEAPPQAPPPKAPAPETPPPDDAAPSTMPRDAEVLPPPPPPPPPPSAVTDFVQ